MSPFNLFNLLKVRRRFFFLSFGFQEHCLINAIGRQYHLELLQNKSQLAMGTSAEPPGLEQD